MHTSFTLWVFSFPTKKLKIMQKIGQSDIYIQKPKNPFILNEKRR